MCITAIMAGASIIGGLAQAGAARSAASAQERAADKQLALQKSMFDTQVTMAKPYDAAGRNALGAYQYELGLGAKPTNYTGFQKTPGYDFQMQEGIGAIDASKAAAGNLRSGSTLQAAQQYGQNLANTTYDNYLNRLYGQIGIGQAAVAGQAAAAQNYAQGGSNALANAGNAQAAGAIGVGNAISGMTNNLSSALMMRSLLQ